MVLRSTLSTAALAAALGLALGPGTAMACSLIFWNDNGQAVVAARTMDLYIDDQPRIIYLPRGIERRGTADDNAATWTSKYASTALTGFDAGSSDGLNEAGLSVHLLYLHGSEHEPVDKRPTLGNILWPQYVLDNFATVAEALDGLKTVRVISSKAHGREWPLHLSIEDASGDSAVIEFVDGREVVHHGKDVRVMTNEPPLAEQLAHLKHYKLFGGNRAMPGDIDPMSRFVRAASYLKTLPKPADPIEAVTHITGVAQTVAVPFGAVDTSGGESSDTWPTRWISVADHTHKVYYVRAGTSPNAFWVDLGKLDPNGKEILAADVKDLSLSGEVSGRLAPYAPTTKAFPPNP